MLVSVFAPQVEFWSQHVSFILVGVIVVASIRGLLITFTKVHHLLRVAKLSLCICVEVSLCGLVALILQCYDGVCFVVIQVTAVLCKRNMSSFKTGVALWVCGHTPARCLGPFVFKY